ncbi:hypothetical protein DICVIV_04617 [Dictyocaulus viviparus]|uniref:Transporter, cation channel family protein n=1 Tax=Dictyocaulus viviparus TaxID=29172 RepID=A0A0D8XZF2_DICVI|nr:hypothetical protein DICVIV_04617 [Dictyocaulus viviparus]
MILFIYFQTHSICRRKQASTALTPTPSEHGSGGLPNNSVHARHPSLSEFSHHSHEMTSFSDLSSYEDEDCINDALPAEVSVVEPILRVLQLLCENHNNVLQNFIRKQSDRANFNLVAETLSFLDTVCGSTKGSLGVFGEIGEHNFSLITQTLATLTEFCQGPCHENQNTMAMQENGLNIIISLVLNDIKPLADDHMELALEIKNTMAMQENGLNIIISLVLNDIKPLADDHMELALEIKSQASKLLLAIMESRHDSVNAERVLHNMGNTDGGPKQLVHAITQAYEMAHSKQYEINVMRRELLQRSKLHHSSTSIVSPLVKTERAILPEISVDSSGTVSIHDDMKSELKYVNEHAFTVDPKEVGHNIYILAHQLAGHSQELARCLNPDDENKSPKTRNALNFYKKHTAQIEVRSFIFFNIWQIFNRNQFSFLSIFLFEYYTALILLFYFLKIVRQDRTLERVIFPIHEICSFLTKETKQNIYNNTERDNQYSYSMYSLANEFFHFNLSQGSKVTEFFDQWPALYQEMKWQRKLKDRPYLSACAQRLRLWGRLAFLFAVLINIIIALYYPFDSTDNFALEVEPLEPDLPSTVFTDDPNPETCSADNECSSDKSVKSLETHEDDKYKIPSCETLRMCIITTLNWGLRNGGGIGDVLRNAGPEEKLFYYRIIYDLSFYIVLIVIVLNLIFGVIIDTFGDLRTEKNDKEDVLKNSCFICGLERGRFDNRSVTFEEHQAEEHNLWHYLYFIVWLQIKDETEFTGPESYVAQCVKDRNLDWFPRMQAISLQDVDIETDQPEIAALREQLRQQSQAITELTATVDTLRQFIIELRT